MKHIRCVVLCSVVGMETDTWRTIALTDILFYVFGMLESVLFASFPGRERLVGINAVGVPMPMQCKTCHTYDLGRHAKGLLDAYF